IGLSGELADFHLLPPIPFVRVSFGSDPYLIPTSFLFPPETVTMAGLAIPQQKLCTGLLPEPCYGTASLGSLRSVDMLDMAEHSQQNHPLQP
ncbi:MAG TPA: hypothetical protein DGH68_13315, partial [Bacteroidetes bacterium]|nr:hypothetical protein [Bacteroidota bacterium]